MSYLPVKHLQKLVSVPRSTSSAEIDMVHLTWCKLQVRFVAHHFYAHAHTTLFLPHICFLHRTLATSIITSLYAHTVTAGSTRDPDFLGPLGQ
ncbi:predicted protein [Lichtheimia corymbifera JMRC:FSU:9682]|uniref:Uncharacterized protein n=1 Tax=Lichtheimia corymbifera JMRC:FSU:9682 TaxID=1263082 RepID=A0A068RZT7_9FUNG|nr:predicted protein [Lichtheimia corymbifera JMRC:FSU:9682]